MEGGSRRSRFVDRERNDITQDDNNLNYPGSERQSHTSLARSQSADTKTHRKSRRPQKISSVSGALEGLEDDMEDGRDDEYAKGEGSNAQTIEHNVPSERVYVQNKKGFESSTRGAVINEQQPDHFENVGTRNTTHSLTPLEFAILLQHGTRLFFRICHGLLGGLALCHIILVLTVSDNQQSIYNFAEGHPAFARAVQVIYYILATLCFISVLDRCDFAHLDLLHCGDLVRYRLADLLLIIIYFGVLVSTVICTRWDDRLALTPYNWGLWIDPEVTHREFLTWRILSVVRGFMAIIGFITLFFGPEDDLFYIHLCSMMKYQEQ